MIIDNKWQLYIVLYYSIMINLSCDIRYLIIINKKNI